MRQNQIYQMKYEIVLNGREYHIQSKNLNREQNN